MKILKGSLVVAKAEKRNNLYVCVAIPMSFDENCANLVKEDKTML